MLCSNSKYSEQAVWLSTRREALQLGRDVSIGSLHASSLSGLQFREKNVLPYAFCLKKWHSAKVKRNILDKGSKLR